MIDLHCDTMMFLTDEPEKGTLFENPWKVDIGKLKRGGSKLQDFALFVEMEEGKSPYARYRAMLDAFRRNIEAYGAHIVHVRSYADIEACYENGKIAALLSVEEGGVFEGDLDKLRLAYEEGVRLVTISWNFPNGISYPHGAEHEGKGLTEFGREFVGVMEELGMIVDCSHLNDAGTFELGRIATKPFIASHSNARALTPHTRNLTDELMRLIAEKGGVVGLNFSKNFLGTAPVSRIEDIVRHGTYIRDVGGSELVALGTDFDGIEPVTEVEDIGDMPRLYDAFRKSGWTAADTDRLFFGNADRLLRELL